jgi:predicted acyltransferase
MIPLGQVGLQGNDLVSSNPIAPAPSGRIVSVDALRGFDMFWIIGGQPILLALVNVFVSPLPAGLEGQMSHAKWEGFTA